MSDTLSVFGVTYTGVEGFKAQDSNGNTVTYTKDSGGGGGGSHARQAFYQKFYPAETYTMSNRLSLQLEASDNCFILVRATSFPTAPASGYKALLQGTGEAYFDSSNQYSRNFNMILRANGTIGTDDTQIAYNKTTGILFLGGTYGYFFPEDEYEVIQVVFE